MPVLKDIPSRRQEESRIVARWLTRLHGCMRNESPQLLQAALERTGLSREQLRIGEELTQEHFDRVMAYLRREIPDIHFRFISSLDFLDLGMLGYAVLSCPTVGHGVSLLARYIELTSDRFTEEHQRTDRYLLVRPRPSWRHFGEEVTIAEDCLFGNWNAIRLLMGPTADTAGAEVRFAFSRVPQGNNYREYFKPCRILYDTEYSELAIPLNWLDRPIASGNAAISDVTNSICERLLGPGNVLTRTDTSRAVRRLLLGRPGQHMLRLEEAAEMLHMSAAQLRKRLYRAGTSYKNIVLEVRMGLAAHYLETTHLSIQEIAYLLDYSQPGPFSRAFKKHFGQSPREVRLQSLQVNAS